MNDEARDAHLRQALRHAPDRDAAPPPALSASILAQARAAMPPAAPRREVAPPWWSRLWQQLATPAFGGAFASVMLAGVIGVMWQDGPPPEALPGAERDLAKAPAASAPAPVVSPSPAPAPAPAVQDRARADQPPQALHLPTMPAQKAAPPAPPAAVRAPKAAESSREVPAAAPAAENAATLSGAVEVRKQRAAAGPLANTAPEPVAAPPRVPAAPPALAQAPAPAPAPMGAAAPAALPPTAAPVPPPAPAAVPPARSIAQEATRDAEAQPLTARREASTSGALGGASLARPAPALDPLAAPLAALASTAPDDARSRDARQALLDARRRAIGPWQPVETPTAEPTLVVVAPDGAPLGRLWIDERGLTWQSARGSALRALKAPPPR